MKQKSETIEKEFHAVDFMRKIRSEMTEQFSNDRKKYLEYLKKAMEDFKLKQKLIDT